MLKEHQDAFGRSLMDCFQEGEGTHAIERDDGYVEATDPSIYFAGSDQMGKSEKDALAYVRGRVLDVGCGAGRHSLHLQEKRFDVTGLDESPLALEVARERGLRKTLCLSAAQISSRLGAFDTIIMMGNNLGLLGSAQRAKWLLRRLHHATTPQGRIIGQNRNPYSTDRPDHLAYHERNRQRGRLAGQLRLRIRYHKLVTPWFDYLFVSPDELRSLIQGTGWLVARVIDGGDGQYLAVLDKEK